MTTMPAIDVMPELLQSALRTYTFPVPAFNLAYNGRVYTSEDDYGTYVVFVDYKSTLYSVELGGKSFITSYLRKEKVPISDYITLRMDEAVQSIRMQI